MRRRSITILLSASGLAAFLANYGDVVSIWTMRADGSHKRRLTSGSLARWSPDGRKLVFARHAGSSSEL